MDKYDMSDIHTALRRRQELVNTMAGVNRAIADIDHVSEQIARYAGFSDRDALLSCTRKVWAHLADETRHITDGIEEFKQHRLNMDALAALAGYDPQRYVATIRSGAVRDAQFCTNELCEPDDDAAWLDIEDAEVYLGIFSGTEAEALDAAAEYAGTHPHNIQLYAI